MPSPVTRTLVAMFALLVSGAAACARAPADTVRPDDPDSVIAAGVAAGVPRLRPTVLGTLPHDTASWTQGLELADGKLYEGTGLAGRSRLRELDPATGAVLRETPVPDGLYGEGITVLGSRIWELTWKDGVAVSWDRATLSPVRQVPWQGEGWGICHTWDGRVIASDGSDRLRVLSGSDLAPLGTVPVRIDGRPVTRLNELECVDDAVWANVWQTDWLVRIELDSGRVTRVVDAAGLLPSGQRAGADVLNGIAAIPGTDEFLVTGKLWPTVFRVRFAP